MSDEDCYVDVECDAERRAHHNALERRRRDGIKESFNTLRNAVPSLHGARASRAQVLKQTATFIATTRRKNAENQARVDVIQRESKLIEKQIRLLQQQKMAAGYPETSSDEEEEDCCAPYEGGASGYDRPDGAPGNRSVKTETYDA